MRSLIHQGDHDQVSEFFAKTHGKSTLSSPAKTCAQSSLLLFDDGIPLDPRLAAFKAMVTTLDNVYLCLCIDKTPKEIA